ncbi:MAG TPA: response regulator transcription factor [Gaiellaceae bacterium]|jgi:two-component system NarL family response regulator|nr:response regulator transcription factor [Gaiellaceae bacterium]
MRLRVLVVDDHPLFAEAVAALLESDGRIEVVGRAENGAEAVDFARKLEPDVVLMDIKMPLMTGIEATERILAWLPETKVVIVTAHGSPQEVEQALMAGAVGCLTKDDLGLRLVETTLELAGVETQEFAASFSAAGPLYR